MKRAFSLIASALAFFALTAATLPADAAPGARLRFGVVAGGGEEGPPPGDLAAQTVYFGPATLVGNGDTEVCAAPCAKPWTITSAAPLNYVKDSDGLLVTKDGNAGTAYNAQRTTGALTSETFTITDANGKTKVINAVVDAARAGTRTVAVKPSKDDVGGVLPQWVAALRVSSYGDVIAFRSGSRFNTPDQTGVNVGAGQYSLRNGGSIPGVFTGENHVVIRPETGGTATLGPLKLDGQNNTFPGQKRLDGLRFQNLTFYGVLDDVPLLQSTNLVSNIDVFDSAFYGDEGDWLNVAVPRPRGITKDGDSGRWRVHRSEFRYLQMGVVLPNSNGTANGGAATYSDPTGVFNEVVDNTFRDIYADAVAMPCATGAIVTGNFFTDKRTGVNIGGPSYPNPFDTSVQPHGDAIQFSNTSCGWGRLAGPTVVANIITRGSGRDSLPFWTVAYGYPDPNTPGPSCCTSPNPAMGYSDYQGIFTTGSGAGKANHAAYDVVWVDPIITHNFVQNTMGNGMSLPAMENPIVEYNIAIADEPGPANLVTSPFGAVVIQGGPVTGNSGRFRYNIGTAAVGLSVAGGATLDQGTGAGQGGTTNMLAPRANYATLFDAPAPSRRTVADVVTAFKPKVGGPLFVNDNQPAGVWCPSGELRSAAAC